ncbi:DUF423 domain-containing protein [Leptospira idonii]|uniref:DUF423 domain-containing protein n=1 Tax=Leptospira idonii TaxID=1193500 RepID=A0A4R9LTK1_9LEPT|nr:DUF423 domain-containing protein [Leptospira idonii]TGN17055.1 DUF423 domain-containing protein [Leptospira idonii]
MNLVKNQSLRLPFLITCLSGFLAVAIGAFGAHGLKETIGERLPVFDTGSKYHFYHTIVCLVVLVSLAVQEGKPDRKILFSVWFFIIGILLFSFSLYTLAITGQRILGAITPLGGVCFLIGWILLGIGLYQSFLVPKKN